MSGSGLQDFGSDQPIWRFVAEVSAERFTGEAELGIDPRVALFATEGRVYAAEMVGGPTIGQRLVQAGALTPEQLAKGAVHVGDTLSLARMFQREPGIDRDRVELALEQMTESLLDSVSSYPVGQVSLRPLRHHPSGVHQWQPEPAPAPVERPDDTMAALMVAMSSVVDEQASTAGIAAALPPPPPTAVAATFPAPAAPPAPTMPSIASAPVAPIAPVAPEPAPAPAFATTDLPTLGAVGARVPAPVVEETREPTAEHRFAPTALDSQQLPKLMDRPMSMVEITAAHAVITGETPPPVEESKYAPVAVDGLPTLQGFAPLAATAVVAEEPAPTEPEASEPEASEPEATEAEVTEAEVTDTAITEPVDDAPTSHAPDALHIPSFEALLDTPVTDWSTPAQPPAVQEIWDMVDDLLGLPHHDVTPPPTATPTPPEPVHQDDDATEPKRRTWMRSRKG